jgi:hypothetical protein
VIPCLKKVDEGIAHTIDQSVSGCDSPRPDIGSKVPQRFGLSNPAKGIPPGFLHQIQDPQCGLPVGGHPVLQVLHAFVLNDGDSTSRTGGTLLSVFGGHRRSGPLGEAHFVLEAFQVDGVGFLAAGADQCRKEADRIVGRLKEMSGLLEARELLGRKERHSFMSTPYEDGGFASALNLVP